MSFIKKSIKRGMIPHFINMLFIVIYGSICLCIPLKNFLPVIPWLLIVYCIGAFVLTPFFCFCCYNTINEKLKNFYKNETTPKERTLLLENLMFYPMFSAVINFVVFLGGSYIIYRIISSISDYTKGVMIYFIFEFFVGSILSATYAYKNCYRICRSFAVDIVAKGVDPVYVKEKKCFGQPIKQQLLTYIGVPALSLGIITIVITIIALNSGDPLELTLHRILYTLIMNTILQLIHTLLFFHDFRKGNKKMTEALEEINNNNLHSDNIIETDLSDEVAFNIYLSNELVMLFRDILNQTQNVATMLKNSSQELTGISYETESTSVEQSAGTKEIVSTMSNISSLSHNIESKITEVSTLSYKTFENLSSSSEILQQNLDKMNDICVSNDETISAIKQLSTKITSIWEVLNLINSVADQSKIIAFNAELESCSNVESNENFKNVSSEIRRLADLTVNSTKEIKETIDKIQLSSENLIKASQKSSTIIKEGSSTINGLSDSLMTIKDSSQNNAKSAATTKDLIYQQTKGFEQIVEKLQTISLSIQNLSLSTKQVVDSSTSIHDSAQKLETLSSLAQGENNE